MPGRKREADSEEDEERFESAEDSEEDVKPKVKRQSTSKNEKRPKTTTTTKASSPPAEEAGGLEKNDQGEQYAKLSDNRRLTVRTFNKRVLVDIREFYKDKNTGELKPGSKGISLTKEQWTALKGLIGDVDSAVESLESK